jgi:predicted RNA-binding Zn-ribbon protein involved in translation (DUF1610 family)
MPRLNLQAIRSRAERLACHDQKIGSILIHWDLTNDHCPGCGYDNGAHALAAAEVEAETSDHYYIWVDTHGVAACPQCGAPNPNAAIRAAERSKAQAEPS